MQVDAPVSSEPGPSVIGSPVFSVSAPSAPDLDLAITLLNQIDLPPICVNWRKAYPFLVRNFCLTDLIQHRVRTFSFIAGDARPLFCKAYVGVLTLLSQLPEYSQSATAAFLHHYVYSPSQPQWG